MDHNATDEQSAQPDAVTNYTDSSQNNTRPAGIVIPALEDLREQFESGALGWQEVLEALKMLPKPWSTKEWKAWRDDNIGPSCIQCGNTAGPLVIQHLRQPISFSTIRSFVSHNLWNQAQAAGDWPDPEPELIERETCPKCASTSIRWFKTQGSWRCMRTKGGRPACRHEFPEPVLDMLPDQKKWATAKQSNWRHFIDANKDIINREALRISFEESRIYLSMAYTTTFCKKCAFLWDKRGMRLCECGRGYHEPIYPSCWHCHNEKTEALTS